MMINIHIGLPKTGTTSFQKRVYRNTESLERLGCYYPKEWILKNNFAHHSLSLAVLNECDESNARIKAFLGYMAAMDDRRVLISSEGFTNCIQPKVLQRFIEYLGACSSITSVSMVLVLRRMDKYLESMYLHSTKVGRQMMGLSSYVKNMDKWAQNFFSGLSIIEKKHPEIMINYLCHDGKSDILLNIFSALDIGQCWSDANDEKKVHNIRLGAKTQAFLLDFDKIKNDLGISADRLKWINAFEAGKIAFPGEITNYTLLEMSQSAHIREHALDMSRKYGITAYGKYFELDDIDERACISLSDGKLLTKSDFEYLKSVDETL